MPRSAPPAPDTNAHLIGFQRRNEHVNRLTTRVFGVRSNASRKEKTGCFTAPVATSSVPIGYLACALGLCTKATQDSHLGLTGIPPEYPARLVLVRCHVDGLFCTPQRTARGCRAADPVRRDLVALTRPQCCCARSRSAYSPLSLAFTGIRFSVQRHFARSRVDASLVTFGLLRQSPDVHGSSRRCFLRSTLRRRGRLRRKRVPQVSSRSAEWAF